MTQVIGVLGHFNLYNDLIMVSPDRKNNSIFLFKRLGDKIPNMTFRNNARIDLLEILTNVSINKFSNSF